MARAGGAGSNGRRLSSVAGLAGAMSADSLEGRFGGRSKGGSGSGEECGENISGGGGVRGGMICMKGSRSWGVW